MPGQPSHLNVQAGIQYLLVDITTAADQYGFSNGLTLVFQQSGKRHCSSPLKSQLAIQTGHFDGFSNGFLRDGYNLVHILLNIRIEVRLPVFRTHASAMEAQCSSVNRFPACLEA